MHGMEYKRYQREKHIKRKERILKEYREDNMPSEYDAKNIWDAPYESTIGSCHPYWYVKNRGYLAKGKIHCSCGMCSAKTRNKGRRRKISFQPSIDYCLRDRRRKDEMDYEEEEYENGDGI